MRILDKISAAQFDGCQKSNGFTATMKKAVGGDTLGSRRNDTVPSCLWVRCAFIGLLLIVFTSGCGSQVTDGPPAATPASPLVGKWRQSGIATAKQAANCPSTLPLLGSNTTSCGANDVIEFRADGTFTATFSGSDVTGAGTWRLMDNKLVLTFTAPPAVAGTTRATIVEFSNEATTINIHAKMGDIATIETYTRQ
ncbi:MAG TPA: lipocalin family protein [Verrucomicrobiae bacterium]|nr:lipocalin family protein [Verrucomicrobiae bacterium]